MENYDLIIIGAGAAGLFTAVKASENGVKTAVFESGNKAGRKLLITGQGKCNITNSVQTQDFIKKYGDKTKFVRKSLYSFQNTDLTSFLSKNGLKTFTREDGKVFPETERASDITKLMMKKCKKENITFFYNSKITKIIKQKNNFLLFVNESEKALATASKLIISTGGFTFPKTGSDGSGFKLAERLGHKIVSPKESLCGTIIKKAIFSNFSNCSGITVTANIKLFRHSKCIKKYTNTSILLTHNGLSGPGIIDNSRDFYPEDILQISFFTNTTSEILNNEILDFCKTSGTKLVKSFFTSKGIPERLVSTLLKTASNDNILTMKAAELPAKTRKEIIAAFTEYNFVIDMLEGRNKAMCTCGGVDTSEINPSTMESRIVDGLYFAGEVIDVDGDSGGYNLQFAFSSAHSAITSIVTKN
ncbi:MAG: aminoacetone oxidase family FAD-binding enzyme [Spirochaetales bacterium]|nr:aminoacetone oxidase family FAD-binding enzyme [Spirochaetales bacterium]